MGNANLSDWTSIQKPLEQILPRFLPEQRWFGGKTRAIQSAKIVDRIPVPIEGASAAIHFVRVNYEEGGSEIYSVPLIERVGAGDGPAFSVFGEDGVRHSLTDALRDRGFLAALLDGLASSAHLPGMRGEMAALPTPVFEPMRQAAGSGLEPMPLKAEQSNTSILYGRCFVLKFFRHVEEGVNPDCEMGEFLSVRARFPHVPPAAGSIEYRRSGAAAATIGILQGFVANRGDAWQRTIGALGDFYDAVESGDSGLHPPERVGQALVSEALRPAAGSESWLGEYRASAYRLGRRTGELHLALSSDASDPDFRPEPFSIDDQREVSRSMIRLAEESFGMLRRRAADLPEMLARKAQAALAAEKQILARFELLGTRPLGGLRTRIHGDLHLGQILDTGDDFVFIDFEGEPARSLAERRAKHSPVRDVAGMLRSFHYAAYAALFKRAGEGATPSLRAGLAGFANGWYRWASVEFLRGYLEAAGQAAFLPDGIDALEFILNLWLLDKAVYELKYELNHRLDWLAIPLEGICSLVDETQ